MPSLQPLQFGAALYLKAPDPDRRLQIHDKERLRSVHLRGYRIFDSPMRDVLCITAPNKRALCNLAQQTMTEGLCQEAILDPDFEEVDGLPWFKWLTHRQSELANHWQAKAREVELLKPAPTSTGDMVVMSTDGLRPGQTLH